ncbi:hypothetical protein SAMD00019534_038460, partial [Acytostelium subglobosum LB1]|uniref:hypothetical protein n=1 Tax=Acytostelium subglobosum LB1 TaxID=1410327 RepID=UPI000644B9A8
LSLSLFSVHCTMNNPYIIAALSAGIGAAATYISTKAINNNESNGNNNNNNNNTYKKNTHMTDNNNDDDDIKPIDTTTTTQQVSGDPFAKDKTDVNSMLQQEIFDEQMNRTMLYYGEEAFKKIRESFVIVVGLGGVGGAAAHVMLRSGVKKIRLIDPDLVTISSLNRNVLAQRKDVGRSKVETMKSYFNAICPEVEVEAIQSFFTEDVAATLLGGNPDYVLDCIDNTETKVQLLTFCKQNNLKVISSFGAGSSSDPTRINICDLSFTFGCPFGKEVRRLLRKNGITTGILCVCSSEKHRKKLIPLTEQEKELLKTQVKSTLRIRTLGVSMPIPFIFGTTMGNTCLNDIVGLPTVQEEERQAPPPMSEYNKMLKQLIKREQVHHNTSPILIKKMIDSTNLRFTVEQVFQCRSCITDGDASANKALLTVVRWRPDLPLSLSNLVVMTNREADLHDKYKSLPEHYSKEVIDRVDGILSSMNDAEPSEDANM